jgi:3-oxoacyl-[acyl-carrier-protein] synthase II
MTRRVVITGMGTINPLGTDVAGYWKALCAGRSGIGPITLFDTSAFKVHFSGEVPGFDAAAALGDAYKARRLDRFAQFALVAARSAVKDSGIDFNREDPYRCGVIVGTGIGGIGEFEEQNRRYFEGGPNRISAFVIPKMIANAAAGNLSIEFKLCGPNTAVATACASAANAITDACRAIQWGYADVMMSGGSEAAITEMGLGGFINMKAVSMRNDDPAGASRPFDKDRDGFVLSEGAGIFILEELERARKRGATLYAEVLGCGSTADAYNITSPHPCGQGAGQAMRLALQDARLNPEDIDYVNAHGTSTQQGDKAETEAIKAVFGNHARRLVINSTKSMTGHLLGASGGIELIACIQSLRTSVIHPTINLQTPDPDCDLDYVPNTAREVRVRRAISNSFGFGGHNCSVIVGTI